MSWKKLQTGDRVRTHKTSKKELKRIAALNARDLEDAATRELSASLRIHQYGTLVTSLGSSSRYPADESTTRN
jgi:hypothetical protein